MALFLYGFALILILLATAAFIVYLVRQKKSTYHWAYRLLLAGFAFLTLFIGYEYYALGVAPVLTLKSSLSFFAWTILLVYLLFHLKFRLMVLGSFVAPLAACLLILSSTLPARRSDGQTHFQESLAPGPHRDGLCGERIFCRHLCGRDHVPDSGVADQEKAVGFSLQQAPVSRNTGLHQSLRSDLRLHVHDRRDDHRVDLRPGCAGKLLAMGSQGGLFPYGMDLLRGSVA